MDIHANKHKMILTFLQLYFDMKYIMVLISHGIIFQEVVQCKQSDFEILLIHYKALQGTG